MVAILIGNLCIAFGLLVISLPVLVTELSRPRDSVWGAAIMILGLILITSNQRFTGSPMLAVLLCALLVARLLVEISKYRWQQLSLEEQVALKTFTRWKDTFIQNLSLFGKLIDVVVDIFKLFRPKPKPSTIGKKWIRPETNNESSSSKSEDTLSREASITKNELVSEQPLKPTSTLGNNPSDVS